MRDSRAIRILLTTVLTVAVLLPAGLHAKEKKPKKLKLNTMKQLKKGKKQTIVCFGTSLTSHGAWVNQMKDSLYAEYQSKAEIVNSGTSGGNSDGGVKNLKKLVIAKKPNLVFIEFAINDCVKRFNITTEKSAKNLEFMISQIKASSDCEIILLTMNIPADQAAKRSEIKPYYDEVRKAAKKWKKKKVHLVDLAPAWRKMLEKDKDEYKKYVNDGIHPTAEGCKEMILPVLAGSMGFKAK